MRLPPHIADDKDEKDDVQPGDAVVVHFDPRANEQHRGTGGGDEIGEHRSDKQEDGIDERCGLTFNADYDAARDLKQGADQRHEAHILMRGLLQGMPIIRDKGKIARRD